MGTHHRHPRGATASRYWKRQTMFGLNVSDNTTPPIPCPICGLRAAPALTVGNIHLCQNCGLPLVLAEPGEWNPARRASLTDLAALTPDQRTQLEKASATILKMLRR
jgi:predicted RNA-binding Zn-ribbon protein involved in translation (DUF1610 family)